MESTSNKRVSLGIKQLERDPWETIEKEFPVGTEVDGTVSKVTNFGAFIKFANGLEGLVHISELSNSEVTKVEDILKIGQTEKFKVIKSSRDERKLGLSLRAVREPEATAAAMETQAKAEKESKVERKEARAKEDTGAPKVERKPRKAAAADEAPRHQSDAAPIRSSLQQALEEHAEKNRKGE